MIGGNGIFIDLPTEALIRIHLWAHPLFQFKGKIKEMYIVGSFARGNPHKDSDVDLLLWVNRQSGYTDESFTEKQRKPIRDFFVKNKIMNKADEYHPNWANRRMDIYFTFNKRISDCIKLS